MELALSEWGLWADEWDDAFISEMAVAWTRRKRYETQMMALAQVEMTNRLYEAQTPHARQAQAPPAHNTPSIDEVFRRYGEQVH